MNFSRTLIPFSLSIPLDLKVEKWGVSGSQVEAFAIWASFHLLFQMRPSCVFWNIADYLLEGGEKGEYEDSSSWGVITLLPDCDR